MLASTLLLAGVLATQLPDGIARGVGEWEPEGLGNHRFVVEAPAAREVRVDLPWRRRDANPEGKAVIVVAAKSGERVVNVRRVLVTPETGSFLFEPSAGAGLYYFYYLPYTTEGKNYPKVTYLAPEVRANNAWAPAGNASNFPAARVLRYEAISAFHAFDEMEITATSAEADGLLAANPKASYLVFPEDRSLSIRMFDHIPYRWAKAGANRAVGGVAKQGEYFTFQLGVWAARADLSGITVRFSDLKGSDGAVIRKPALTCFNTTGIDYRGKPFAIDLNVPKGRVQALWCGIEVPEGLQQGGGAGGAAPGEYQGSVVVSPRGMPETRIPITLVVGREHTEAHGDDDPFAMTRLRWLNSTLAEDDAIVRPFEPVSFRGRRLTILGRAITLGREGLPAQMESRFDPRMTRLARTPTPLLAGPMELVVEDAKGARALAGTKAPTLKRKGPGAVEWSADSVAGALAATCEGRLELDGTLALRVAIEARQARELEDIRLEIPIRKEMARYLMGLGRPGGTAPHTLDWKWSVEKNQEGAWVGSVNAGLQFALRDERYSRPLNTNFYHEKPLVMPASWDNGGRGGIRIATDGDAYRIVCYSGPRRMLKGEVLRYDLHLMLTPFKTIDPPRQFSERYFHAFKPLSEVEADGANVVNIHHATDINPWINYPFLEPAKMKAYVDEAHERGMRLKVYNTIRELTNHAPELFMLRSLGHEVFSAGKGGGYSWLQEHLDGDYIAAWHVPEIQDAALVNSGMSRWHNFYVEGMDWLARNIGIDGLNIDHVAFDSITMKRVRKVLDRRRPNPVIDLHSANQFNERDGWNNSANLYMEHMPFLDRLWFGEYFDYDKAPDFWLTEVSGLPFGLMGEMLEKGGNPWRGMVFGMTARRPWAGDPRALWKAWDAFGIIQSEMIGWWAPDCPVHTDNPAVLATVYQRKGKALIALASWASGATQVRLKVDWKALGIDPARARLRAVAIEEFQSVGEFAPGDPIPVEAGKGWLLQLSSGG